MSEDVRLDARLVPEAAELIAAQHALDLIPRHLAGVEVARERVRRTPVGPRSDELVEVCDVDLPGGAGPCAARLYRPRAGPEIATVLYFHGGGWALGDLEINDHVCRRIAASTRVALFSLAYRLAPEHPFPCALEDGQRALEHLAGGVPVRSRGGVTLDAHPSTLAVAGLSAGGSLAAALARRSRDGLAPALGAHLLICPVLDHDFSRRSYDDYGAGLNLTALDMAWFWDMYCPERPARDCADASPLRAESFAGLPPAVVIVGGADVLRDESVAYCAALHASGVNVEMHVVDGVPHGLVANPEIASANTAMAEALAEFRVALRSERVLTTS